MEAKIENISKGLESLGFITDSVYDTQAYDRVTGFCGIYNKKIEDKQLFLHYNFSTLTNIEDNSIYMAVLIELHQVSCEFDSESGLKYFIDLDKEPLAYFNFDVVSNEKPYINDKWNQDVEDSLREIAVAKVIEIEELIWNKIKEM